MEDQLKRRYNALYSRMQRDRVDINLLSHEDAEPFAQKWVEDANREPGVRPDEQPLVSELVNRAWVALRGENLLFPGGKFTPRDLLATLASEVDGRVE